MREGGGGPPNTVRTRGSIEAPTAITPVNTDAAARLQEARRSAPRAPAQRVGASLQARRTAELKRQRRMRHAKIVHSLGWRATFEGFDQLARDLDEHVVDCLLERLANVDPYLLEALRANELPPTPIREVRR